MESILGRYRNLIILAAVLCVQLLGLAVQVRRGTSEGRDTRLIRIWAVDAITPFERAFVWAESGVGNLWHNYFYLRGVRAENRQLKAEIEDMRLRDVRLMQDAAQARRLQTLLAFKEQYIAQGDTVAAQVIGSGASDMSRIITIDKGENAGIKTDMAVITADGIVGKVLMTYPSISQVLLISDQTSGVGAILEKTRTQGVLRGSPNGEVMLEKVMSDEQVDVGETVLTSGGDRIFPKGLPVGTVSRVGNGKDLFLNIKIKPAADLSKLEEVLVVVQKHEREATADDGARVRAADILAQRLPSVPDKPADAGTSNATGNAGTATAPAETGKKAATANSATIAAAKTQVPAKPDGTSSPAPTHSLVPSAKPQTTAPKTTQSPATVPAAKPVVKQPGVNSPSPSQPSATQPAANSSVPN